VLTITVPEKENWDEAKREFFYEDAFELQLEHSLVSLSKWEAIYEKPFLSEEEKTPEEIFTYVECMILGDDIAPEVLSRLNDNHVMQITDYINSKPTATWFAKEPSGPKSHQKITSELIYSWLIAFNIPWEAQHWHLERLFTLIKVVNAQNTKPKKRSANEIAQERARLNAERMAKYNTTG
jgi:hypothetical protein